ncbi:ATP-binding protein [Streptomyces sp. NPDC006296]|uniref:ATP-binding protein n=1 Tax=Streptomyces sp. NPDC006296 TaxID=3156746 RepID=UPI0033B7F928
METGAHPTRQPGCQPDRHQLKQLKRHTEEADGPTRRIEVNGQVNRLPDTPTPTRSRSFAPKQLQPKAASPTFVAKTSELIEEVKILGPEGLAPITYPFETLHEIITNAVIHRDYGTADDVHVRIFDNRVEVESPGRLPAHITTRNILKERFSRNGAIVRLINKFPDPPNKDVGEGLATAFAAMKKLKLKDPVIEELENSVLVNIRHERLGSPEEIVMQYLTSHEEINNRTVRSLTGIGSENKVKTIFLRLIDAGQIERVPGKRGSASAYRMATSSE